MMGFDIHRLGLTMPLIDEHVLKSTHSFGVFFFFFFSFWRMKYYFSVMCLIIKYCGLGEFFFGLKLF